MVEPSREGLTIMGEPSSWKAWAVSALLETSRQSGVGRPFEAPDALGHDLVHGDAGRHDAGAGIGDAQQLQRALHRAVLAVAAMQGDEAALVAVGLEFRQVGVRGIERMGIDAARAQRLQHAAAGHERDLALGRIAAHEHGHLAQRLHVDLQVILGHCARPSCAGSSFF
ncbi:1-phosphofructokinase [Alicycliphilus sp. B1]|nr:1-phosphofructokinase [Alicycliphilus sp. B1]